MEVLAKAISSGSLRGARGNSGVILSQLFRGFTKGIKKYEEIDVAILAAAFQKAVETAYKAVMKPKEGTILTVAKGAADKALELAENDISLDDFLKQVIEEADAVLAKTPEMLPVLKEAGVVDSGGQGLVQVLKGAYDAFLGKEIDYTDSIVVVSDEDVVKVHVHTNDPGKAISRALTYGSLTRIKIDNMREEHQEKLIKDAAKVAEQQKFEEEERKKMVPPKPVGFISVSIGEGIGEIFRELGVDYLIEGGQTMNPSTEDMLRAIEEVNAETIYILPNNKNIILAANQAKLLTKDKEVIVIPTKTVPQGITAVVTYSAEASVEENTEAMSGEIKNVKTGQITYAVRDTHIDDKEIHEGDIMGIGDHEILAVGKEIQDVTLETIALMDADDAELITVYYGEDTKAEDAEKLEQALTEKYPSCDVEVYAGGQPIYYYVVSVE